MKIYSFNFNYCIYEGNMTVQSLHKTKTGACKAMNKYLNDECQKIRMHPKTYTSQFIFGRGKEWMVDTFELLN